MNIENESKTITGNTGVSSTSRAGKYLTFRLAEEEYGLEILKVREIIGLMEITKVPRTPAHIRGVINLRGKVIPVIDLRLKFNMEYINDTDETCIIVVEAIVKNESIQIGVLVDAVSEVLNIQENEIEDAPSFGFGIDTSFILGLGKVKNEVKILLDIDRVLTDSDVSTVGEIGESQNSNYESESEMKEMIPEMVGQE